MKIGEFSKKFNVAVSTVRHYISLGLLVPEKDGFKYNFTNNDCEEMEIIETMKDAGFKLNELNKYLSIFRFYSKNDYMLYEKLTEYLNTKKRDLYEERRRINSCIRLINSKIKEIEANDTYTSRKTADADNDVSGNTLNGFPLNAVSLLHCPHCRNKLQLSNVSILGDSITNGELNCACGYNAAIKNGILFTDDTVNLENDPQFLNNYFGEENLVNNEDGMLLIGMDNSNNDFLTNMHKCSLWIYKELSNFNLDGKTILFPDMACQYLYTRYDDTNSENSLFIVTALTERTIRAMRQHIANANPNLKVAYIINQDGKLPLSDNCIDAVIDYMGSTNLGFFAKEHYFNMISPYMSSNALIFGALEYYSRNSDSIKKIHELYSNASDEVLTLGFAQKALKRNHFEIAKSEKINEGYDPGKFFEYHIAGDHRTNMVYLAKRNDER